MVNKIYLKTDNVNNKSIMVICNKYTLNTEIITCVYFLAVDIYSLFCLLKSAGQSDLDTFDF